ncbi:Kynurenine 3-monooxygenase [Beauveria bassiana]|uniref:Kynurenine 3-monooxygenase n=1 Tax=Beauveria bassiana TaxID=176275 RepID=A0A2N6NJZ2_BEABA|nr:Kynurenine 3-monooxygenase [Beauveria bassiana]
MNLTISERGMKALRKAEQPDLLQRVIDASIPFENNLAIDCKGLTCALLDSLDALSNIKIFFNHKFVRVNFHGTALFEDEDWLSHSAEVKFDMMLGADGAHSTVRYNMKVSCRDYQHEYIDLFWCEFNIKPGKAHNDGARGWKIMPNCLHIWPAGDFTFIAIPNKVRYFEFSAREFLCLPSLTELGWLFASTVFMPASIFATLKADESQIPSFFDAKFPGVRNHISDKSLI